MTVEETRIFLIPGYGDTPLAGTPYTVHHDGDEESYATVLPDGSLKLGPTLGTWQVVVGDQVAFAKALAVAWRHSMRRNKAPDLALLDAADELGVRDMFSQHIDWSVK